jgi:hypothetical protein
MHWRSIRLTVITALCGQLVTASVQAKERVTPDNFRRAESDFNFKK